MELPKIDPKIAEKADAFAEREYETNGYERQWLSKGYYHGYKEGYTRMENKVLASLIGATIGLLLGFIICNFII